MKTAANVIILDNGAGKLKFGRCGQQQPQQMSNCTANVHKQMQVLVGDQVDAALNGSLLHYQRPHEKGYLTKWGTELEIWGRVFGPTFLNIDPSEMCLAMTEPSVNPTTLQNDTNEVVFEEFGFDKYSRRVGAWYSAYEFSRCPPPVASVFPGCCTVLDSGFSFSHIMPFIDGFCKLNATKRVNVGGKFLTNYLKELVSYRQWNMMDEFKLIDQVKEDLCYVSLDMMSELESTKAHKSRASAGAGMRGPATDPMGGSLRRMFVLPDFQNVMRGFVKPEDSPPSETEQLLVMESERFSVPELLFTPSIVGLNQAGVAEAAYQSLKSLHEVEMGLACANIVLTGGNTRLPQFKERFERELRSFLPDQFPMQVHLPANPETFAWTGASHYWEDQLQQRGAIVLEQQMVSRKEYLEQGHARCNSKFYSINKL